MHKKARRHSRELWVSLDLGIRGLALLKKLDAVARHLLHQHPAATTGKDRKCL